MRLPTRGKSLTGRALSRYFVHEGLTSYTHVSDQHSTFGTQIIVSTERDATFTLDEILGNTTELPLLEHTTDSHGQTLVTFAMFDLVGRRLSPRIAKLTEKQLWNSPDFAESRVLAAKAPWKDGTPMPKTRPAYPEQFRREALELVRRGRTIPDVGPVLGSVSGAAR